MEAATLDLYPLLRPLLFALDAERAHNLSFSLLSQRALHGLLPTAPVLQNLRCAHFGLHFANPLGLAAGLDKNAELLPVWQRLGFGFAEVGTVTPRPQAGNARPRLFRLAADRALINRMGFNNHGAEAMARRLEAYAPHKPHDFVVGVNLGKNKDTPNDEAEIDYVSAFERLRPYGDYFVVNVSSPNTPGLRELQDREGLTRILGALQHANHAQPKPRPLLLKIAPDLGDDQLDAIIAVSREHNLSGLVATNTTLERRGLRTPAARLTHIGAGGLSGAPLHDRSTAVIRYLTEQSELPVIGVGGIVDGATAHSTLQAGARLLQVYTGLIYRGPAFVREVLSTIARDFKAGICTLS